MNHFILFYFFSVSCSLLFCSNGDKYTVVDTRSKYSRHKEGLILIDSQLLNSSALEDVKKLNQNSQIVNVKHFYDEIDAFEILKDERFEFLLYLCADEDQKDLLDHFFGKLKICKKFKNIRFNVLDIFTNEIDEVGPLRNSAERLFLDFYKKGIFHEFESNFDSINILMVINPTAQADSEPKFLSNIQDLKGQDSLRLLEKEIGVEAVADSGIIFIINSNEKLRIIPISLKKKMGL